MLDLGCAGGLLGAELRRRGNAVLVHGVEVDAGAANEAEERLDRVWVADLDVMSLTFTEAPYDVVIVADVLEHVRDPWRVLNEIVGLLDADGYVVASLPNIRFIRVLGPLLLRGRFDYADSGVLDRTHLRFFTRSSVLELFHGAGLRVEVIGRAPMVWRRGWRAVLGRWMRDLGTEQFLVRARR